MVKPNKGSPKKSEDRARTKQETERLKFERQKLYEEHLRAELRDVYFTHREVISLFFKIFLYASLAAGALGSLYITINLSSESDQVKFFSFAVSVIGECTAVFFSVCQRLSFVAFLTSRNLYLYPIRRELGMPDIPDDQFRWKRKRLEQTINLMLALAHSFYVLLWACLLYKSIQGTPPLEIWI